MAEPTFPGDATVSANSFVDVALARAWLKVPDQLEDAAIAVWINQATGIMERLTARRLRSRSYKGAGNPNANPPESPMLLHSGDGSRLLLAEEWPVTQVTAARERHDDGSTESIDTAGLLAYGRRLLLNGAWPAGVLNIELDCRAGYDQAAHAEDYAALSYATLRLADVLRGDWQLGIGRGTSASVAGGTVSLIQEALPRDVAELLARYQRLA